MWEYWDLLNEMIKPSVELCKNSIKEGWLKIDYKISNIDYDWDEALVDFSILMKQKWKVVNILDYDNIKMLMIDWNRLFSKETNLLWI